MVAKLLLHLLEMFLHRGEFSHGLPAAMHLSKDFQPEAKLLGQPGRSRGRSRIHFHLQVLGEVITINNKFNLIDTWRNAWALGRPITFAFLYLFGASGAAPPEVPNEPMHAGGVSQRCRLRQPAWVNGQRRIRWLLCTAREAAN